MYTVRRVVKPEELEAAYRLRYQIFCLEKKWLNSNEYPDGREIDEYDEHAVHFIVWNEGKPVGTTRVIRHSEAGFPMETVFKLPDWISRINFAEVSRLSIIQDERPNSIVLLISLCRGMWHYGYNEGITYWGAVMDEPLYRMMRRIGLHFIIEGPTVFYVGSNSVPVIAGMGETKINLYSEKVEALLRKRREVKFYV